MVTCRSQPVMQQARQGQWQYDMQSN